MVPVRPKSRDNPSSTSPRHRLGLFLVILAILGLTVAYFASIAQSKQAITEKEGLSKSSISVGGGGDGDEGASQSAAMSGAKITLGEVMYGSSKTLPYYRCGPLPSSSQQDGITELVLLHGAAFTKEDWKTSGILESFCNMNNDLLSDTDQKDEDEDSRQLSSVSKSIKLRRPLSVLALDLPVSALGPDLSNAFDSLTSDGLLSGKPFTVISPSASGKTIVNLGELAFESSEESENKELSRMIKAWIPVASGSVLQTSQESLNSFVLANIPILAIHGDQDSTGRKTTDRLVSLGQGKSDGGSGSVRGVELKGRHPVYLDSPDEFVDEVLKFLEEKNL